MTRPRTTGTGRKKKTYTRIQPQARNNRASCAGAQGKGHLESYSSRGQTTPANAATAKAKFRGDVRAAIIEHNISNVFNADQTAIFFEYLPRKTEARKQYG
ncbi:hypothetical protein PC129_g20470 [Phytophthora cactorum]|uniref:Uncharacterized protein n=1 Tax=Phytophthora cactorum TaxID=29920 RepID=A0A8T0Y9E2_9STRA|nr:hypothetical protein PC112_g21155 [Phytophthora cactorum]KAG2818160.1 hypothetical protein PC111_g12400 [Phytophthora cactorum]KAG2830083.1 hypothetical protein PC113_g21172 [Phytophthora cactorum]KAG2885599.1 hypothetical protein PC115_g20952 [Phytophthora cactorum]KAG2895201.1 hypothetical protein PC117_g23305 [Phytophthora cactorum]